AAGGTVNDGRHGKTRLRSRTEARRAHGKLLAALSERVMHDFGLSQRKRPCVAMIAASWITPQIKPTAPRQMPTIPQIRPALVSRSPAGATCPARIRRNSLLLMTPATRP